MESLSKWFRPVPVQNAVTDMHFVAQRDDRRMNQLLATFFRRDHRRLLLCTVIGMIGIGCFLYSMMFQAESVGQHPRELPPKRFPFDNCFQVDPPGPRDDLLIPRPRVILFVIDAWRYSFLADEKSPMTFLRASIEEGNAILFNAEVQAPTVTMPRIKAMTCGVVPTFSSALWNFGNTGNVTEDSFLKQAYANRRKTIFYGDDTWLQMYPAKYFTQYHGVESFFVKDYSKVDDSVTDNFRRLMTSKSEWDLLILHYLGLDHIGHSLSADPNMIKVKLTEMDQIIKEVFIATKQQGPTVLIVAGDHGMTDFGSHGGPSYDETHVPIVIFHSNAHVIKGHNFTTDSVPEVQQVDLASTMSALLKVNKPADSLGVSMMPYLTKHWQMENRTLFWELYDQVIQFRHVGLGTSNIYDALVVKAPNIPQEVTCNYVNDFVSSSGREKTMSYFKKMQRELLSAKNHGIAFIGLVGICVVLVAAILLHDMETEKLRVTLDITRIHWRIPQDLETVGHQLLGFLIVLIPLIFSFASSMVEEEHDTWYLLTSMMLLVQTFSVARHALYALSDNDAKPRDIWPRRWNRFMDIITNGLLLLIFHRVGMSFYVEKRRRWQSAIDLPQLPVYLNDFFPMSLISPLSTYFDMKLLCSKILPLTIGFFTSVCLTHRLLQYSHAKINSTFFSIIIFAFCIASCFRVWAGWYKGDSDAFFSYFQGGWVLFVLCAVAVLYSRAAALIFYLSFLVRLENFLLIFIVFEMGLRAKSHFIERSYLYVLFQAVFFYMGTSNSLQNIDVRAGYMGLTEYNSVLVGFQMLLNTYALQIVLFIAYSLYGFPSEDPVDSIAVRKGAPKALLSHFLLNMFHYKIALTAASCLAFWWFSNHLFVWSVYAPKAFFECIHGFLLSAIALIITTCVSIWG